MVSKPEVLALIPARGGSKSIPRKNLLPFAGHPLVAYSIAAGKQAERVTRVIVSTDDEEIAQVAREYGAEVPFLRPSELARDDTPDLPVFLHALDWLKAEENYEPEFLVQLRPTSPLRPRGLVDSAIEALLGDESVDCVRGVVPVGQNPYKMWRIDDDGHLTPLLETDLHEAYNMPRQELPQTYWQTGHIDAIRTRSVREKNSLTGDVIRPLVIDPIYTVDIDTVQDSARAEMILARSGLDIVWPGAPKRKMPSDIRLVVLDFDGVLTDDRVWVNGEGTESVAANRSDGMGIERLKRDGVEVIVLSREMDPVVKARCEKLQIPVVQGLRSKAPVLSEEISKRELTPDQVIYVGNDVNDLECFPVVGYAIAVADAHPSVIRSADMVLSKPGGHGAVRELSDRILELLEDDSQS